MIRCVLLPVGALNTPDSLPAPLSGTVAPFARVSPDGKLMVDVVGLVTGSGVSET